MVAVQQAVAVVDVVCLHRPAVESGFHKMASTTVQYPYDDPFASSSSSSNSEEEQGSMLGGGDNDRANDLAMFAVDDETSSDEESD